ncbi:MAG: DUF4249 family protein [Bacteroidota bacterium]
MIPIDIKTLFTATFLAVLLSWQGCVSPLEIDNLSDPMLSIHGWWFQDKELKLDVSNTIGILDPIEDIRFVHDAQIKVWEDEVLLGMMTQDSSIFGSEQFRYGLPGVYPKPGSVYRIEVAAAGYDTVTAETEMPLLPKIKAIRYMGREVIDPEVPDSMFFVDNCRVTLEVDIEDYAGIENFYEFLRITVSSIEDGRMLNNSGGDLEIFDPLQLDISGLVSDQTFEGGVGTVRLLLKTHCWTDEAWIKVALVNSPMEYVYHRRGDPESEGIDNPFIEPTSRFSNVVGGVGQVICFPYVLDSIMVQE